MLTDSSALIAIVSTQDAAHETCSRVYDQLGRKELLTTWPCWTEAMHLLGRDGGHRQQSRLWGLRRRDLVILHHPTEAEVDRMEVLMAKYSDLPMDLADASLVALAEYKNLKQVFTCDGDFYTYQLADGSHLEVIPGPAA